jgi:hypothetical protein
MAIENYGIISFVAYRVSKLVYRCPLRTEISSMAIRLTFFKRGLENRRTKSFF